MILEFGWVLTSYITAAVVFITTVGVAGIAAAFLDGDTLSNLDD